MLTCNTPTPNMIEYYEGETYAESLVIDFFARLAFIGTFKLLTSHARLYHCLREHGVEHNRCASYCNQGRFSATQSGLESSSALLQTRNTNTRPSVPVLILFQSRDVGSCRRPTDPVPSDLNRRHDIRKEMADVVRVSSRIPPWLRINTGMARMPGIVGFVCTERQRISFLFSTPCTRNP